MTRLDAILARRSTGFLLFFAFLLLWATLAKAYTHSWQEESRLATVQALAEQGTFVIDHTDFDQTGDKVFVDGHFYSNKLPLFSAATAGVYSILHSALGMTLDPTPCVPADDASACRAIGVGAARLTTFYWLTLLFAGVPSALLVALFWKALRDRGAGGLPSTAWAILLGLTSPIAPYSIVYVGHVPAALCLFAGFKLLMDTGQPDAHALFRRNAFWAGLLLSVAANIDLLLSVFVLAVGVWIVARPSSDKRWASVAFAAGALFPYALTALMNYSAAGTIWPLYFDPKGYDYPGTAFGSTFGGTSGFSSLEFGLRYAYDMLVGRRGLFAFTPVLLYGLAGMGSVIRDRRPWRGLTLAMLAGSVMLSAYLIARTDNFGGLAWGTRWFVPLAPIVYFFIPVLLEKPRSRLWRAILIGAVALSAWNVLSGVHDPWTDHRPVIYPELTTLEYQ